MPSTENFKNNQPQRTNSAERCSRRDFLRLTPLFCTSLVLVACGGITPDTDTPPNAGAPSGADAPPDTDAPPDAATPSGESQLRGTASQNMDWVPFQVIIDKEKCTGCAECVGSCPASVLELVDGKAEPVNLEECLRCETCVEVCKFDAIRVFENY